MNVRTIYWTVTLSIYYSILLCVCVCLPAGYATVAAWFFCGHLCFYMSDSSGSSPILSRKNKLQSMWFCTVRSCACACELVLYMVSVCAEGKQAKWTFTPWENLCVCQRWGLREHEKTMVCVCERERNGQPCCYFLGQAVRQQGGIITEAVTFLWFLWFQHEAGGWLWLTHGCTLPAWKLPARGQYMTFLGHFNLRRINYRTMSLCIFQHPLLKH